jgi:hypothetical protein
MDRNENHAQEQPNETRKQELALISTQELVSAVMSRFDSAIFMGVQNSVKTGQDAYYHNYSGCKASCLGLCEVIKNILLMDWMK